MIAISKKKGGMKMVYLIQRRLDSLWVEKDTT
jgi:hypothetical protein